LRRHRLRPIEDPSNSDDRRRAAGPALQVGRRCWPPSRRRVALAGAARRAQEANAALAELAAFDLAGLVDGQGRLQVAGWRRLSAARQANALRAWWATTGGQGLSEALLRRLLVEVPGAGAARWPAGAGGVVRVVPRSLAAPGRAGFGPGLTRCRRPRSTCPDLAAGPRRAGAAASRSARSARTGPTGARPELLRAVQLRPRCGGERFQREAGSLPRSLKKQYQTIGVPEHARGGPLLWSAGQLLFAPGLGIDVRCRAAEGEPGLMLRWCADPAPSAGAKLAG